MDRRTALKILGVLTATMAGGAIPMKEKVKTGDQITFSDPNPKADFLFDEKTVGNMIIIRTDGREKVIPLSEIFDALEE